MSKSNDADIRELQTNVKNIIGKVDDLKEQMRDGFKGVYKRLDVTNGKVIKNADKIDEIEKEMFQHEVSVAKENKENAIRFYKNHELKIWGVIIIVIQIVLNKVL